MKLRDLIQILQDWADSSGEDVEVRFASQPGWPFEYEISDVVWADLNKLSAQDGAERDEMLEELTPKEYDEYMTAYNESEEKAVIYLVEGRQIGYLPPVVKDLVGW